MKLFIAVNFNEEIKDSLMVTIQELKKQAVKGNFTRQENVHLTLVFIGEVQPDKVGLVKTAMNRIDGSPFDLRLRGIGKFKKRNRDIYWVGVEKNDMLYSINRQLTEELKRAGFSIEDREYSPHLTLGREVLLKETFDQDQLADHVSPMNMTVRKISLMKSEQVNGKLTYTEIYSRDL